MYKRIWISTYKNRNNKSKPKRPDSRTNNISQPELVIWGGEGPRPPRKTATGDSYGEHILEIKNHYTNIKRMMYVPIVKFNLLQIC